ncbi:acetate/propionate family kinase [Maribacter sp. 2304DJ31-5]|uniref:acetate/propionate family kinase n=1 Tax=Maribacter sp. 2304DJ31-5 TaxID=3386273 RepID=UPI0039BC56D2
MNILVINSGSSSIKFQLIKMPEEKVVCKGLLDRIGLENGSFSCESDRESFREEMRIDDHKMGLELISKLLLDSGNKLLSSVSDIHVVGHRVVHGGSKFNSPTEINADVLREIETLSFLAPLHNPANAEGIKVAMNVFTSAVQIAVFDTAFHHSLPEKAYTYAISKKISQKHKIRTYGFHGTSHKYVAEKAIVHLQKSNSKIITVHLGNGCSITAVKDGRSIDHSLGFGPSNGLVMGTRCGDIDQSVIFYLVETLGFSVKEVNELLQKQSGFLGLTGHSDVREIEQKAKAGDRDCILALELAAYRVQKYIGAYMAALSGLDAIVFTAGIGENSATLRRLICKDLDCFGILLDTEKNNENKKDLRDISDGSGKVRVFVIPTNEELEIARQSFALANKVNA